MPEPRAQALVEELGQALSTANTQETATKADIAELQGTVQSLNERLDEATIETSYKQRT